ncbi:hypothetical protein [Streptomyces hiroshimensis]|uniref:Uncharacterized protein n=1 Tax=Streptomyces hiroshimensis TaxID=66424 RepID=A0ABQ2Y873_9ACTN|nr:hypothetical protein [Streptomyces hiroshimensis]GGX74360.1 hypothetical protein GCM10010324_19620 [Streptomyces hiroshimensis]
MNSTAGRVVVGRRRDGQWVASEVTAAGDGRQQLTGFSVEGPVFLAHLASIFDRAWGALQPLDEYVARQGR